MISLILLFSIATFCIRSSESFQSGIRITRLYRNSVYNARAKKEDISFEKPPVVVGQDVPEEVKHASIKQLVFELFILFEK